ncbi:MAG: hypothetical protein AAF958_17940, partial [Planctomycetota bacterium]
VGTDADVTDVFQFHGCVAKWACVRRGAEIGKSATGEDFPANRGNMAGKLPPGKGKYGNENSAS